MQGEEKSSSHRKTENTSNVLNNYIHNEVTEVKFIPSIEQSLKNIIDKEDFISYKVSKNVISAIGNNFFGDLFEIDINGKTKEGYKEIHLFLKRATACEALKPIFDISICYLHEMLVYNELSPIFNTLQENANIAEKERFKIVKSYECNLDAIILENIARKGFKTLHRMDFMSLKFAQLAIAQLAKLHGLSLVLKYQKSDYFDNKIKTINPAMHRNDLLVWEALIAKQFGISTQYFEGDIKKKLENFKKNCLDEKYIKYYAGVTGNERVFNSVKCLCHRDFRINNVMFKENDEEISDMVIIDYQMVCYGTPVVDLLQFIYTGTNGKFRKAHLNNLRDQYHEELTKFLKHFNLDINDVYPKEVYERDFHDSLEFGLMVALIMSPVVFTIEEEAPDFGEENLDAISYKMDDRYEEWMTEIVEEYLAWGILK